jgi:hypothetical protein
MAVIKSGATSDQLTVDATSKAARVTMYDSSGREVSSQSKSTYMYSSGAFTVAASATDIVTIYGSASKTVRIIGLRLNGLQTTAGQILFTVIKRSTADSGGTGVAGTAVPVDSNNAAATATVTHYTANPTLGTGVGSVSSRYLHIPAAASTTSGDVGDLIASINAGNWISLQPITLRGTGEGAVINLGGVTVTGGTLNANISWIEE